MKKIFPVFVLFLSSCAGGSRVCDNPVDIDALSDAMKIVNVKEVRALPCGDQRIKVVKTEVEGFKFDAIVYESDKFADTYAARNFSGSRVDEIRLILENKIPHTWKGGNWLRPKHVGIAEKFDYMSLGPNTKVEEVFRLSDGRIVKHVIPEGSCAYFAVETPKKVFVKRAMTTVLYPIEIDGKRRFENNDELAARGVIPPGGKITKTLVVSEIVTEECSIESKVVLVEWQEEKVLFDLTIYPYY